MLSAAACPLRCEAARLRAREVSRRLRCCVSRSGEVCKTRHVLDDGTKLEVLSMSSASESTVPPILFLHGTAHAAWCWEKNWFPFFTQAGFDVYAISFRGHGASDTPAEGAGTLADNARDLASVVAALPAPPLIVGHSAGGLILQRYLLDDYPPVAGAALVCSAPPSGNKAMVGRLLRRSPILTVQLTWSFITKNYFSSSEALRRLFFSSDMPDAEVERLRQVFVANAASAPLLNVRTLQDECPLPALPEGKFPPAFVLGGTSDNLVDEEACVELGKYLSTAPVMVEGMAHDCMLDTQWRIAAEELLEFLQSPDSFRMRWLPTE